MPGSKRRHSTVAVTLPLLDATVSESIRLKAHRLVRRAGLPWTDGPDVAQDMTLHVWTRLSRYEPTRASPDAFVRMLVAHAAFTVLRDRLRIRRRAPASLASLAKDPGGQPSEPADPSARSLEDVTLAIDVAAVLSRLPLRLRRVAEALKTSPVTVAARRLGLSRAEVYRRLAALRSAFEIAGLGEKS